MTVRGQRLAVAMALAFPTVLTVAYFVLLADYPSGVQQAVYAVGKTAQFAFPLVWVFLVLRERVSWTVAGEPRHRWGIVFGAAVLVGMLGLYSGWLKPAGYLAGLTTQVMAKVRDLGLDQPWKYMALGVFYRWPIRCWRSTTGAGSCLVSCKHGPCRGRSSYRAWGSWRTMSCCWPRSSVGNRR